MWPIRRKRKSHDAPGEACEAAAPGVPKAAHLTQAHREALLALARVVLQRAMDSGSDREVDPAEMLGADPACRAVWDAAAGVVGRFGGVFVTLWSGNVMRGCIGTFQPTGDIASAMVGVARSALNDPRFRDKPVGVDELADLTVEVSLLSDLVRTGDPLSLVPGRHGVLIRRGEQSGCFLPKVAVERGWSAAEFLTHCCTTKADLPADAWRDQAVEVYLFTAESFRDVPPGVGQA